MQSNTTNTVFNNGLAATKFFNIPNLANPIALDLTPGAINYFIGIAKFGVWDGTTWKYLLSETDADLRYKPINYTPTWSQISGKPTFSSVATSGIYADLIGKPVLFSGDYLDLINKPNIFSGSYTDLANKPTLFNGSYAALTGKPALFSGDYNDLINKPVSSSFSGDYVDLINKPTLFDGQYSSLTGKPIAPAIDLVPTDGSSNSVSSNGVYDSLTGKWNLVGGNYASGDQIVSGDITADGFSTGSEYVFNMNLQDRSTKATGYSASFNLDTSSGVFGLSRSFGYVGAGDIASYSPLITFTNEGYMYLDKPARYYYSQEFNSPRDIPDKGWILSVLPNIVAGNNITVDYEYVGNKYIINADLNTALSAYYPNSNPNNYTSNTGTVTSISATVPIGLQVTGSPVTSQGTLAIEFQPDYSIPTLTSQTTWNNKQDALTGLGFPYFNNTSTPNWITGGQGGYIRSDGVSADFKTMMFNQSVSIVPVNQPMASGQILSAALNRAQGQIDNRQVLITLTTNGTGTATFVQSTGMLNIPTPNFEPIITSGSSSQYYRGDKTFQTLDTSVVTENGNLYSTNARSLLYILTGYSSGANSALSSSDTFLGAFQKIQGQISARAPLASPTFTGTPLTTTAAAGTNTTQIASTAFVTTAISNSTPQLVEVSVTTQALVGNRTYIFHASTLTTATLPSTNPAIGTLITLIGDGSGQFRISQNAGQFIVSGNATTTVGTGGYIQTSTNNSTMTLRYVNTNKWMVTSSNAAPTIV
jgi:hypothetical protein